MSLKQLLDFSVGACAFLLALSMFFWYPSVEAWIASALGLPALPSWLRTGMLLEALVALPAVFAPLLLVSRARGLARPALAAACLTMAALFLSAAASAPLLAGRVALVGLLTGQLLALGGRCGNSVPLNWMLYLGFILANLTFPDAAILAGANFAAALYLLFAGGSLLLGHWEVSGKRRRYRVMVG